MFINKDKAKSKKTLGVISASEAEPVHACRGSRESFFKKDAGQAGMTNIKAFCIRTYTCSRINNKGISLIEVMIALVVLLLVFVGLLQAALLSIDSNMRNILRDEAVNITAMKMEEARSMPFDNVVSDADTISEADCPNTFTKGERLQRNLRNMTKDFCINLTCRDLENNRDCILNDATCNTKQINVRVIWNWKGEDYIHSATTVRRR